MWQITKNVVLNNDFSGLPVYLQGTTSTHFHLGEGKQGLWTRQYPIALNFCFLEDNSLMVVFIFCLMKKNIIMCICLGYHY